MSTLGTETVEGYIPHLRITWRGYEIDAPVALRRTGNKRRAEFAPVRTWRGQLVYALPRGEIVVEGVCRTSASCSRA